MHRTGFSGGLGYSVEPFNERRHLYVNHVNKLLRAKPATNSFISTPRSTKSFKSDFNSMLLILRNPRPEKNTAERNQRAEAHARPASKKTRGVSETVQRSSRVQEPKASHEPENNPRERTQPQRRKQSRPSSPDPHEQTQTDRDERLGESILQAADFVPKRPSRR